MKRIVVCSERPELAAGILTYAKGLGAVLEAVVFSSQEGETLLHYGAQAVFCLDGGRPEGYAKALAGWLRGREADLFLVGSTAVGRELGALTAGYADAPMISEASELTSGSEGFLASFTTHGGLISRQVLLHSFSVVSLPKGIAIPEQSEVRGTLEHLPLASDTRVARLSEEPIPKTGVDLSAAKRIVSIGMGCDEADVAPARRLANLMDGELGCSRSLAEQRRWLPLDRFVGISGAVVKPELYLTLGISGQIQHVFGARDSKFIAAVNRDESAPIFEAADYGIVGDLHTFLPLLIEILERRKG